MDLESQRETGYAFLKFQGVRTNNLKKSNHNLKKLNINLNTSVPLFKKYLNIKVDFLNDYKNSIDMLRENITLRSKKLKIVIQ